ncbi:hypothetical protein A3B42_00335 [Candidatus Daviesbacteria bacterium RIFCSPLOWO2_01_FULL_38_10]|nr:MAG: hypothetical protein A3D02_02915 [Candidatus Daviesbacteria bacterium RIFCSPHIGHO2_02_FULL_39_41]OGE29847.1 MAG: hypothetical protein A2772_02410 [Candidatus Daviesbacteria bacterium RIFCSPHIGHO2_01_FULL_38_8b]OGE37713.1 MAG: hypothetical protein A3B42_00335 [Candidatus Daviesbacteria bacterium RIFCSPLOWO2_01_FULL_38_10]OGE44692.1 MAG: hypothetical protein A3E67_04310 [Candidatus Daviesbacteria bacterium RIFCSPHIGHO2_12_FULL_38_25]OGE68905.1 MAG: hypothetical protein A3H81_05195 [Candid
MSSRSWNRVELIGNLTRDPELRYTPNGAAVCTFGLATNRTYVTEGERKEEVDFHRLVSWNKLAELCNQLLKKGTKVFISGRLQTRSWEGNDGQTRQTTEIVVEDMIVLTPRSNGDMETPPPPKEEEAVTVKEEKVEEKEAPKEELKKSKEPAAAEEVSEDLPF